MPAAMPVRATKRGDERTPLHGDYDVLVCGASFAGLDGRPRAGGHAAPGCCMVDRYEIGERQTSACAAPTEWLEHLGLMGAVQQTFARPRRPRRPGDAPLDAAVDVLDLRLPPICALLRAQGEAEFETAKVDGRRPHGFTVHTDRGDLTAPLIVDALGWRRDPRRGRERPAARGAPVARAGGPPARRRRRPRAVDRPEVRPARLLVVVPRRRRAARRRRLVRPARPRQGPDARSSPPTSACPPSAGRATGSRTSCARPSRTGSSSSATAPGTACRRPPRGSAPRSTSGSRSGASCATCSRAARRARRRSTATARSRDDHEWQYRWLLRVQHARRAHHPDAAADPALAGHELASASSTGPSGTTWTSARRSSRSSAGAARRARQPLARAARRRRRLSATAGAGQSSVTRSCRPPRSRAELVSSAAGLARRARPRQREPAGWPSSPGAVRRSARSSEALRRRRGRHASRTRPRLRADWTLTVASTRA